MQPRLLNRRKRVRAADAVAALLGGTPLIQEPLLVVDQAFNLLLQPLLFQLGVLAAQKRPIGLQLAELGFCLLPILGE